VKYLFRALLMFVAVIVTSLNAAVSGATDESPPTDFIPYQDQHGVVLRLSSENDAPFLINGRSPLGTRREGEYRSSIDTFANVVDCLDSTEQNANEPNLDAIDWTKMSSLENAEVCIWRITSSYDDIDAVRSWLGSQGFRVLDTLSFPNRGGTRVVVSAAWPLKERGMLVSQGKIYDWWTTKVAYGLGLSVDFGIKSKLIAVHLNYSTK